jgi:hypothetical protein
VVWRGIENPIPDCITASTSEERWFKAPLSTGIKDAFTSFRLHSRQKVEAHYKKLGNATEPI